MSKTTGARMDSHRVRLRTGEGQRKDGSYCFRWTDSSGQRRSLYAPTLQELRMKEDELLRALLSSKKKANFAVKTAVGFMSKVTLSDAFG